MTDHGRPETAPITSPRSDRVRRIASLSGRSARRRTGEFRVDGPKAVRSLLDARPDLVREVFATDRALDSEPAFSALADRAGAPLRLVPEEILRAMVAGGAAEGDLVSPQGIVAVARIPESDPFGTLEALPTDGPVTVVVLDALQDPGNVGTIIRTADAAGADLVLCGTGTADPFAPKVVRSSAGSLFHVPVAVGADLPTLLPRLRSRGIGVLATSGYAPADLYATDLPPRAAWILGNEGRGVAPVLLEAADASVGIPLAGRAESLNVAIAATVCLFEALRRRRGGAL